MENNPIQHTKQRVTALAIIIAVLFQLYLASTAALNPTQVHSTNWLNDVQNEKVLLCTADGFKWVDINTLIVANTHASSSFIENLHLHDTIQFKCPLLQAVQFFIFVALGLYLGSIHWIQRAKDRPTPYHFTQSNQSTYKFVAPKHSPPFVFPA
ncbi:hypothetical protein [Vibrio mytili]|uniref:Uncharacterized protein n=1 Tax=Vibrio mytili TaxID=50718 RepID=A0A0C3DKB8_9VIBR|nr:hypothetical protein [Vibrio mytili]KIN11904.1 hypothetical protein SU60_05195 [Vibrio mytili]